jgi:AraC-like DNA-binding protein
VGGPVDALLRRSRLPVHALENHDNYVPSANFYTFVTEMAARERIADLGFRVGERFGANCADPHMVALLRQSPTMFRGLTKASDLTNRTVSRCHLGMVRSRDNSQTYFYHQPGCGKRNSACDQIAWFGVMTLIGMARVYAGRDWRPLEIGVMSHRKPTAHIFERFPNTRIRLSQSCSYIALPHEAVSLLPAAEAGGRDGVQASVDYRPIEESLVGSLKQVVSSYLGEDLSIPKVADLCNTSSRSLQRQLERCGTTFRGILDEVRFESAREMLAEPHNQIADIAHALGYKTPTNFSRSFRRVAGVSPSEFRGARSLGIPCH